MRSIMIVQVLQGFDCDGNQVPYQQRQVTCHDFIYVV